jgi:hypothetical protein
MNSYEKQGKVRAPEFTGGKGWLNTDKPLSVAGLKGKVVLLISGLTAVSTASISFRPEKTRSEIPEQFSRHRRSFRQIRQRERHLPTFAKSSFATASNIRLSTTPTLRFGRLTPSRVAWFSGD